MKNEERCERHSSHRYPFDVPDGLLKIYALACTFKARMDGSIGDERVNHGREDQNCGDTYIFCYSFECPCVRTILEKFREKIVRTDVKVFYSQ